MIFVIITLILILLMVAAFLWTVIGFPLGLFFIFQYVTTTDKSYKKKLPKRIILSFLGMVILVITPMVWGVLNFAGVFLGGGLQSGFGGVAPLVPLGQ